MDRNGAAHVKAFNFKHLGKVFKRSFKSWNEDEPFRLSAVVAYYALLSLPALLVIVITAAGFIWGEKAIEGQISTQIEELLGRESARQVETMIANASQFQGSFWATILSIGTLFFGATGAFYHLQQSLNDIWKVKQKPKVGILRMLFDRVTAFGLILVIAFLLLISLILTSAITALSNWLMEFLPEQLIYLFYVVNFVASLCVITLLFATIFKVLPDLKIPWKVVWMGALVTSLLFVVAKFALGIYFGQADPASAYGAAGSIVLILLWVFYACLILLFGAEFTKEYARLHNVNPKPSSYAVKYIREEKTVSD